MSVIHPYSVKKEALSLYKSGKSINQTAKILNVPYWSVRGWVRKAGLSRSTSEAASLRLNRTAGPDRERIQKLYEQGWSLVQIAWDQHVTDSRITQILRRDNIQLTRRKLFNNEEIQLMINLRIEGRSYKDIANVVNRSTGVVSTWFRRHPLPEEAFL